MKALLPFAMISAAVGGALYLMTSLSAGGGPSAAALKLAPGDAVRDGAIVALEYTLTDGSGNVLDSSEGNSPMIYVHGQGQIVPGLEKALTGMKTGEEKTVTLKPEEAYGQPDPQAYQEIPKENFPAESLKVGATLTARGPEGMPIRMRVHEIRDKVVLVDFNHPLAGQTLTFKVKVSEIKTAAP
jgi:FKBP-type peptidyl-prolyl cis-trans isomerase SlyD